MARADLTYTPNRSSELSEPAIGGRIETGAGGVALDDGGDEAARQVPGLHPPTLQHRAEHRALGDAAGGKPGLDGLDCLAQSASIT